MTVLENDRLRQRKIHGWKPQNSYGMRFPEIVQQKVDEIWEELK